MGRQTETVELSIKTSSILVSRGRCDKILAIAGNMRRAHLAVRVKLTISLKYNARDHSKASTDK